MWSLMLSLFLPSPALGAASPALIDADGRYDQDLSKQVVVHTDAFGERTRLARVYSEREVDATPAEAWAALARFGDVHQIAPVVVESALLEDSPADGVGCGRSCRLDFQGRDVAIKERVFAWDEGRSYTYLVYDAVNFPLKRMHVTFGVREEAGRTVVYNIVDYRLKPGVLTPLMRGAMQQSTLTSVLSYAHVLETGAPAASTEALLAHYGA